MSGLKNITDILQTTTSTAFSRINKVWTFRKFNLSVFRCFDGKLVLLTRLISIFIECWIECWKLNCPSGVIENGLVIRKDPSKLWNSAIEFRALDSLDSSVADQPTKYEFRCHITTTRLLGRVTDGWIPRRVDSIERVTGLIDFTFYFIISDKAWHKITYTYDLRKRRFKQRTVKYVRYIRSPRWPLLWVICILK